jgi:ABC-type glutathione transport system ATPase component
VLILDEATSALDPETEAAICRTLEGLRGELTIVAISHQSPLVEVADRVYRMADGTATLVRTIRACARHPRSRRGPARTNDQLQRASCSRGRTHSTGLAEPATRRRSREP